MGILTEIVPPREKVRVCDTEIEIRGLSVEAVALGLSRFPELAKMFDRRQFDFKLLLTELPGAAHAAIAAAALDAEGKSMIGDAKAEEIAASLPLEDQFDLLQAIFRLTFRAGFGPFAAKLGQAMGTVPGLGVNTRQTTSRKGSPTSPPKEDFPEARSSL